MMSGMTEIIEAKSRGDAFAIQPQPDGTFRVFGLGLQPIPISRHQARALLVWMQADGIQRLRQMLAEGRHAEDRKRSR
jgi:hypothetical protein